MATFQYLLWGQHKQTTLITNENLSKKAQKAFIASPKGNVHGSICKLRNPIPNLDTPHMGSRVPTSHLLNLTYLWNELGVAKLKLNVSTCIKIWNYILRLYERLISSPQFLRQAFHSNNSKSLKIPNRMKNLFPFMVIYRFIWLAWAGLLGSTSASTTR